jgi:hypothetical protein
VNEGPTLEAMKSTGDPLIDALYKVRQPIKPL